MTAPVVVELVAQWGRVAGDVDDATFVAARLVREWATPYPRATSGGTPAWDYGDEVGFLFMRELCSVQHQIHEFRLNGISAAAVRRLWDSVAESRRGLRVSGLTASPSLSDADSEFSEFVERGLVHLTSAEFI